MQDRLREQWRLRMRRRAKPTATVIDAQSNRIWLQGGESSFDAVRKIKNRKPSLVVDTIGLVIAIRVTVADLQDRNTALLLSRKRVRKYPDLPGSTSTAHTVASALVTSSNYTIFALK